MPPFVLALCLALSALSSSAAAFIVPSTTSTRSHETSRPRPRAPTPHAGPRRYSVAPLPSPPSRNILPRNRLLEASEIRMAATSSNDGGDPPSSGAGSGDKLRSSTGVRASLNPTTINAISTALLLRSSSSSSTASSASADDDDADLTRTATAPIDVWADGIEPLTVAVTAGKIAVEALEKRTVSCRADGDDASIPTAQESQAVAGRVVGVVMRLRELETELASKVATVGWVAKYGEYGSFGVLKSECVAASAAAAAAAEAKDGSGFEQGEGTAAVERNVNTEQEAELCERIRDDPLFRMCRAECLLAIFLQTVEAPRLQEIGEQVPGGSEVDFLDEDRIEVLLP